MKALVVERQLVKQNIDAIKKRAAGMEIIVNLTANAEGLGVLETARVLRDEGICAFAVSEVCDARTLRSSGFVEEQIMMLRSTTDSDELRQLIDLNVICTVGSSEAGVALNGIAVERGTVVEAQIKIDVGPGCYGFNPSEYDKIVAVYRYMSNLAIIGVFTRFSQSWRNQRRTLSEYAQFREVIERLQAAGYPTGMTHCLDSAALFRYDLGPQDAICLGSAISGRIPGSKSYGLARVGCIEAEVEEADWSPKGARIGTDGGKKLKRPTRAAVVSVGWYNGVGIKRTPPEIGPGEFASGIRDLLRGLLVHRRLNVRVKGTKVHVIGGVGLGYMLLDVTKIDCNVGDPVTIEIDPRFVRGLPIVYK